jgi:hypothetical protein
MRIVAIKVQVTTLCSNRRTGPALFAYRPARRKAGGSAVHPATQSRSSMSGLPGSSEGRTPACCQLSLHEGVLKLASLRKSTPPKAEEVRARLYARCGLRITCPLSHGALDHFPDCATHLRFSARSSIRGAHGLPARRLARSRPGAHGGTMHGKPRPDCLYRRLAPPDICPGRSTAGSISNGASPRPRCSTAARRRPPGSLPASVV